VDGAAAAIDFYVAAFGAVEHHRLVGDDGRIGLAEIIIGNSRLMLADEYPDFGAIAPTTRGGTSTSFTLSLPNVDEVFPRAVALGATELRPVADQFYGHRQGTLRDPWGHQWNISSPIEGFGDDEEYAANAAEEGFRHERSAAADTGHETPAGDDHQIKHYDQGDLYYFTLPTSDLAKAQAFYGAVLGWQFPDQGNGHVGNISAPPGSAFGATDVTDLYFVVDDIGAAVQRVRAAGGTAEDVVHYDSGWAAQCTDDQGVRFHLSVPADKYRR
ncbi:MAG: VOC family protein, partial [Ilumatobacteraceae bacterium]